MPARRTFVPTGGLRCAGLGFLTIPRVARTMLGGNHCEAVFANAAGRDALNDIVGGRDIATGRAYYASCSVLNPVQVQLHVADRPLGQAPQRIAMRY